MEATLKVEAIEKNGEWTTLKTSLGRLSASTKYKGPIIEEGRTYIFDYIEKQNGKYTNRYVNNATLVQDAINGHTTVPTIPHGVNGNVAKEESMKTLAIQRDSVLCAIATLEAFSRANLLPADRDEIRTLLQAELAAYRSKFTKDLGAQ